MGALLHGNSLRAFRGAPGGQEMQRPRSPVGHGLGKPSWRRSYLCGLVGQVMRGRDGL